MQGSSSSLGDQSPASPSRPISVPRISWAAEPWADEDSPLIDDLGHEIKPVRKSKSKNRRGKLGNLGFLGKRRNANSYLPLYDDEGEDHSQGCLWLVLTISVLAIIMVAGVILRPTIPAMSPDLSPPFPTNGSNNRAVLVSAKQGAVSTEHPECSKISVQTLKNGGNAVDAVVSSTLCIGVVNMFSSGIGGGGFMIVRIPPNDTSQVSQVFTIDFRETAPAAANSTMFEKNTNSSIYGGLGVGVPSELRGLEEAHKRWGKLPWKELVLPSVHLAAGWRVGRELARRIQIFSQLMLEHSDWSAIFAPDGKLLVEGDLIVRESLSRTLEAIANDGPDAFYKGPIADAMLKKIIATGGIMTQEDLDSYAVRVAPAQQGTYRGRKVYTTSAPSSGSVLLHMLNLAEQFDDSFLLNGHTALNSHRIVEILKYGFAARTKISDPVEEEDVTRMHQITSKTFAQKVFANVTDGTTHPPEYYNPSYDVHIDHGTSHTTVIDKDHMVVSLTSSINLVFGSAVYDPVTGVIFNDQLDDFSKPGKPNNWGLWPSPYNYPAAGKRPLSSIAPTIFEDHDGNFQLALGGSGGSRIFGAILQVALGLDWGLDLSQAIEFPRLHDQLFPSSVDIDSGYPAQAIYGLIERGHNITVKDFNRITSVIQAVAVQNGTIYAASDSRKNGIAAGY